MYFADPYCAWQKGTNENLNGLLREFYPKGRNLSRVSPATLKKNLALINAGPRKFYITIHHKICSLKISLTVALDLTIHLAAKRGAERKNILHSLAIAAEK